MSATNIFLGKGTSSRSIVPWWKTWLFLIEMLVLCLLFTIVHLFSGEATSTVPWWDPWLFLIAKEPLVVTFGSVSLGLLFDSNLHIFRKSNFYCSMMGLIVLWQLFDCDLHTFRRSNICYFVYIILPDLWELCLLFDLILSHVFWLCLLFCVFSGVEDAQRAY